MFRITSESEILQSFRQQDLEEVVLPSSMNFPIFVKDYLAWVEPSGHRIYLVFKDETFKAPLGVVFQRNQSLGPNASSMCEWCHCVRSGNQIGLLSVSTRSRHRAGVLLCRDLSCAEKVRAEPGVDDFMQSGTATQRVSRILARMAEFARRELI